MSTFFMATLLPAAFWWAWGDEMVKDVQWWFHRRKIEAWEYEAL